MIRLCKIIIGCLLLISAGTASSETPQADDIYQAGTLIELHDSGATFIVPAGFIGRYNQKEKSFEMISSSNQQINVGYEGESYVDTIASANKPITTTDGIVMTPISSDLINDGEFVGEVVAYSGKTLTLVEVGAIVAILKTPKNTSLTISSGGLGTNYQAFGRLIGLVIPTLQYLSRENDQQVKESAGIAGGSSKFNEQQRLSGNPDWRTALNGKYYYYIKGDGYGSFDRRKILLCADGTFWTSSQTTGYSTGGAGNLSYNSQSPANEGHWKAYNTKLKYDDGTTKGKLIFNYFNGSQMEVSLGYEEGGVYFDQVFYLYKGEASGCLN